MSRDLFLLIMLVLPVTEISIDIFINCGNERTVDLYHVKTRVLSIITIESKCLSAHFFGRAAGWF